MGPVLPTLPQSLPEQRFKFYEDVETLITSGFLAHTFRIAGQTLAVRSLGPGDLFILRSRVGLGRDVDWKVWTIASSIWMIDGFVLLGEINAAPRLTETIYRLPARVRDIIFSIVMGLFARQNRANDAVESYCYENHSRFKWKAMGPQRMSCIPGPLGMNYAQQMWAFYNEVEDQKSHDEMMWEGFKLTTSPHAPKGIKKIDARDTQVKNNEYSRRQAVHDRFYYTRIGFLAPRKDGEQKARNLGGNLIPKTDDDLADEMYRWVTGQDDEHDWIVKEYKANITARYEYEKQQREAHREAIRQQQAALEEGVGPQRLTAYTPEQLAELLKGRQAGRPSGARVVQTDPDARDYLYSRYLERAPDPGLLRPVDGRLEPVRGAVGSLDDQLNTRRVSFQAVEMEE